VPEYDVLNLGEEDLIWIFIHDYSTHQTYLM
jgi:hypothetical protein